MDKEQVLIFLNKENRINIEYYVLDGEGKIQRKNDSFIAEDLTSCIRELYICHVMKMKKYVYKATLYVKYPYLYFTDIYELGKTMANLSIETGEEINLEVFPVMGVDE